MSPLHTISAWSRVASVGRRREAQGGTLFVSRAVYLPLGLCITYTLLYLLSIHHNLPPCLQLTPTTSTLPHLPLSQKNAASSLAGKSYSLHKTLVFKFKLSRACDRCRWVRLSSERNGFVLMHLTGEEGLNATKATLVKHVWLRPLHVLSKNLEREPILINQSETFRVLTLSDDDNVHPQTNCNSWRPYASPGKTHSGHTVCCIRNWTISPPGSSSGW